MPLKHLKALYVRNPLKQTKKKQLFILSLLLITETKAERGQVQVKNVIVMHDEVSRKIQLLKTETQYFLQNSNAK